MEKRNMKLVVEVIDAHDLMPKDGEGSASAFAEVEFENQLSKTKTVPKNLNPTWNQKLVFSFDPTNKNQYHYKSIEVCVYHERRPIPGRNFLGRVRIPCSNLVRKGEEVYQRLILEKKSFLSFVKGEIGLKVYLSPDSNSQPEPHFQVSKIQPAAVLSPDIPQWEAEKVAENPRIAQLEAKEVAENPRILEKKSFLSFSKGETGLKVYLSPDSQSEPDFPVSKIQPAAVLTPDFPQLEAEKVAETPRIAQLEAEKVAEKPRIAKRSGEGLVEVTTEKIQQVHRNQVLQQPGFSVGKKPEGIQLKMRRQVNPEEEFELKDTNPQLGWTKSNERYASSYDLVEQMFYLYVRVVRAKDLQPSPITAGVDPYVEVKLGNYRGRTRHLERRMSPEWNQVFAFSKDHIQSSILEVIVKEREMLGRDDSLGRAVFDLNEIPTRVPPDSPLAPQWYRLEDRRGEGKPRGNIMVAVWMGTQADEAFSEAWHSDAALVHGEGVMTVRSKVYVSPKLWYLRVNAIEAQDIIPNDRSQTRLPELQLKLQLGNQVLKTGISQTRTANPVWNEDLVFVAAEPFEEELIVTIEDHVHPTKDDVLGRISLPLNTFEKRLDHRPVHSRWFNLEKFGLVRSEKFCSRVHLRACLEGGYHVLDESTMYISDQRPTARQLWKPPVGILEIGIIGGHGLLPMKMKDGRGSTDAYCVAKYGQKWVRTRTILDTFSPRWNEQYTWEVYDPCTVITLGVFDNCHLGGTGTGTGVRDSRIGKVRIRLSTLQSHKIYSHSYPLLVLHPSGVKKMGELQLSVRFTSLSLANIIYTYTNPLLPKMHYLHPFTVNQLENLRYQAMNIVAGRLTRAEPPLRKEVVEYMLDVDSHMWSMRRSKANFFRIMSLLSGLMSLNRWFCDVCMWKNTVTTLLVHVLFLILIWYPDLILPTLFLYMFLIGLWNYRFKPRHPPHMDTKLSWAESVHPDELDEEFDTFPTSKQQDVVRMRYDRLRSVAGRVQIVVGDIATQAERIQSLLSWRDPRATSLFVMFCLAAAVVLYATPFRVVALVAGLYVLRHPKFRTRLPGVPSCFFKRLPARTDTLL